MRVPEVVCYTTEPKGTKFTEIGSGAQSKFPWTRRADEEMNALRAEWEASTNKTVALADVASHLPGLYSFIPQVPEGIILLFWTSISSFRIGTFDDIRANDGRLKSAQLNPHRLVTVGPGKPAKVPSLTTNSTIGSAPSFPGVIVSMTSLSIAVIPRRSRLIRQTMLTSS
ncbi:hypothetical protein DOTSEDRAFT_73159 [Dothistroma septosporum NZE10]|uniref:Uncharacterized protein n=1 Tax=Dothistroma septosporum (strain NZE10 / CBS 128990) TaxID=675120 RepID=N1PJF4_DOTSN|nr:hypothetical protein DOTSEDRAFT_73159 [Dothistroma septosporum NZE10]